MSFLQGQPIETSGARIQQFSTIVINRVVTLPRQALDQGKLLLGTFGCEEGAATLMDEAAALIRNLCQRPWFDRLFSKRPQNEQRGTFGGQRCLNDFRLTKARDGKDCIYLEAVEIRFQWLLVA